MTTAMGAVEIFEYPAGPDLPPIPGWQSWPTLQAANATGQQDAALGLPALEDEQSESRRDEEKARLFEAGREHGLQEGRQAEREALAAALAAANQRQIRQAAELVERFALERERYFAAVEREVVELALAISARILRREAQMDPLLLTGAVRVALGQLAGAAQVRLRVPPAEAGLWTEAIALMPNLSVKPAVTPGDGMRLGECLLETELGSVDLGIRAQLGEIERGFFDRVGPASAAAPNAEAGERAG